MNDQVTVVIPTYNNVNGLIEMLEVLSSQFPAYQVVVVDDGSDVSHWERLKSFNTTSRVKKIRLAKNFGQHAALYAGMSKVNTPYLITMDDDHHNLVSYIPDLLAAATSGDHLVVYGLFDVRRSWFRSLLTFGYRMLSRLVGSGHGKGSGFRLIKKELVQAIEADAAGVQFLDERIRWFTNNIGFISIPVCIKSFQSRYSVRKLLSLSIGKSFYATDFPLRFMAVFGALMALVNLGIGSFFLYKKLIDKIEVPGFTSLIVSVLFSSGLLLFGLGILATYLRQILLRVNHAPAYHIQEFLE
ncbi:MAG: glycosyltransferase [Flavobacteriales bacterium]